MEWKKVFKGFTILLLVYIVVWLFFSYSSRVIPCGEVCIPERPLVHPFLAKISMVTIYILTGPTLVILFPILKFIEPSFGTEISYFFTFIIWILYFLVFRYIYLFIKKFKKKL